MADQPEETNVEIPAETQELIDELESINKEAASRVKQLARESQGARLRELAALEIQNVLNPASIEIQAFSVYSKWPRILNLLEWIRNVLVLVPITLTWLQLSIASSNYEAFLSNVNDNVEWMSKPFLLLWERGFYGMPGMKFSVLAAWDFGLLLVVVFITLLVHRRRDIVEVGAEQKSFELRQRLETFIGRLEEKFAGERYRQDAAQTGALLKDAIEEFKSQAQGFVGLIKYEDHHLQALSQQREREIQDLKSFSETLRQSVQEMARYNQGLTPIYASLNGAVAGLLDKIQDVGTQQENIHKSFDTFSGNSSGLIESIRTLENSLRTALEEIRDSNHYNDAEHQDIVRAMKQTGEMTSQLVGGEAAVRKALLELGNANQNIISGLKTVAQQFSAEFKLAAVVMKEGMGVLNRAVESIRQAASEVGRSLSSRPDKEARRLASLAIVILTINTIVLLLLLVVVFQVFIR